MIWNALEENGLDAVGIISQFLSEHDPRPAREQLNKGYAHGGGWRPFKGFNLDLKSRALKYSGDPAYYPLAYATLRDESIFIYPYAWVAIVQLDGTFEVARMD